MSLLNPPSFNGGSTHDYHVFCYDKYLGTLAHVMLSLYTENKATKDQYVYNYAFIYHREAKQGQSQWWRADGTPYPKEQIPKAYLGMCLLVA